MKVSIIIPVYNVAPYIKRCLDSVAAQTYTGEMECLLVDDCGTDDSIKIAKQWIKNYKGNIRFVIFHHPKNQGQSAARNTGIEVATGDYVYFLDSDDAITPSCIEILVKLVNQYPCVDFVQGRTVNGIQGIVNHYFKFDLPEYVTDSALIDEMIFKHTIPTVWNKLIKLSFIKAKSLYFPIGIVHEDIYWLFFLSKHTQKVAFTNEETYCYYLNENGVMHSQSDANMKKRAIGYQASIHTFIKDILQNGSTSNYQRQFVGDAILNYLHHIASCCSIILWFRFWQHMIFFALKVRNKFSLYRLILLLATMPPFCFLVKFYWWRWRIRHYVIPYV